MDIIDVRSFMRECTLCPRLCHVDRLNGTAGFCGQTAQITVARAALHFWEEPCICGCNGSGAVFFSGCSLQCVFCQNHEIALGRQGKEISPGRLCEIFLELQAQNAVNINLVTPSHFIPQICYALERAKEMGLSIPIVYNSSGYEKASSLRLLEGLVDIYLPDFKYFSPELGRFCAQAPDYFEWASKALEEMLRQTGPPQFDEKSGLMKRGMIVRHLVLPGQTKDSKKILRYLHNTYGNQIYVSIMNQYTPLPHVAHIPQFNRKVTVPEYDRVVDFARKIGIDQGFIQEGDTADESFIPSFDGQGVQTKAQPASDSSQILPALQVPPCIQSFQSQT